MHLNQLYSSTQCKYVFLWFRRPLSGMTGFASDLIHQCRIIPITRVSFWCIWNVAFCFDPNAFPIHSLYFLLVFFEKFQRLNEIVHERFPNDLSHCCFFRWYFLSPWQTDWHFEEWFVSRRKFRFAISRIVTMRGNEANVLYRFHHSYLYSSQYRWFAD
jgi:hypothetical protein